MSTVKPNATRHFKEDPATSGSLSALGRLQDAASAGDGGGSHEAPRVTFAAPSRQVASADAVLPLRGGASSPGHGVPAVSPTAQSDRGVRGRQPGFGAGLALPQAGQRLVPGHAGSSGLARSAALPTAAVRPQQASGAWTLLRGRMS